MKKTTSNIHQRLKKTLAPYKNFVVVGGNWGDEGKGKIIDLVMAHYDATVRFSGGANAGHTVKTPDGKKLVSHLIPCGLAQDKECIMGRGELVDLRLFLEELEQAKHVLGKKLPKIFTDQMSPVWTPWHSLLESWLESSKGSGKVGTTGKGIGPLEGLYKLRMSPVVGQIFLPRKELIAVLEPLYQALLPVFREMAGKNIIADMKIPAPAEVADLLQGYAKQVKGFVADTSFILHQMNGKKRLLFEGAQALGLDCHFGTYPYVSSGNSAAFGAAVGTGLPMQNFGATMMVAKTLPTRVGRGPFPSEMWEREKAMGFAKDHGELYKAGPERTKFLSEMLNKINAGKASRAQWSQYFQVLGDERGATTGRGRSVGFTDIPWLQYACRINGPSFLALTRFDMLSGILEIPVVVGYKISNKLLAPGQMPAAWDMGKVEPVFEKWQGWQEDIAGIQKTADLPKAAQRFLNNLEKRLNVPILLVGTGPGRDAVIVRG